MTIAAQQTLDGLHVAPFSHVSRFTHRGLWH